MKTYAILVSFIVGGLILSLVAALCPQGYWVGSWLVELAAVLVIGGGLGIIDKTLLHRDHFNDTRKLFMIHESTVRLGLEEIEEDANHYSFTDLIRESPSLSVVLNDGRTWVSSHALDIRARFQQDGFITELIVPDPRGDFVGIIAKKTGYTREEQIAKIEQAKRRLIEELRTTTSKGTLRILHMPHFPTYSAFLGSDKALISLYGISSGRRVVPLLAWRKLSDPHCLFASINDDVQKLKNESRCVFDSTQKTFGAIDESHEVELPSGPPEVGSSADTAPI